MSSKEVLGLCLSLAEIIPAGIQSFIPKEGELQKSDRPAQATVTPEWGAGIVSAQPQVLPCHPGIDSTLAWSIGVPRPLPCFAFFFCLSAGVSFISMPLVNISMCGFPNLLQSCPLF